jgi:hypothetical protein
MTRVSLPFVHRALMSAKKTALRCGVAMLALAALGVAARATPLAAQAKRPAAAQAGAAVVSTRAMASAARAAQAPSIDGRDDDAAWHGAAPITGFRGFDPVEDAEPSMRTEAQGSSQAGSPGARRSVCSRR